MLNPRPPNDPISSLSPFITNSIVTVHYLISLSSKLLTPFPFVLWFFPFTPFLSLPPHSIAVDLASTLSSLYIPLFSHFLSSLCISPLYLDHSRACRLLTTTRHSLPSALPRLSLPLTFYLTSLFKCLHLPYFRPYVYISV